MKRVGILALVSAVSMLLWAVPARRGRVVKTQPDGSQVVVYQHGDEYFRWQTNEAGEWIELGEDGFYRKTESLSVEQVEMKRSQALHRAQEQATPLNIAPKGLVILVNFQDVKFTTSKAEMDSMLTGKNYVRDYAYEYEGETYTIHSEGSAWKYFYDSSNGQYDPQFDVVGPVTVKENMEYYGRNTATFGYYPCKMVKEACELLNDSVDFSLYDNDSDGYVDFVYVIYAGYGEADGGGENTIWPHSYELFKGAGMSCRVDGKRVNLYACGNELNFQSKEHTGIGTFCHEFSHVLGLPDLYTTDGSRHKTLGEWDVMDYGPYNNDGNTPPAFSAYERFFMGWLTPRVLQGAENVTLNELQGSNEALLISMTDKHNLIGNDPDPTMFYMLENRQQVGWDTYLPGHGLMLTKIEYDYAMWSGNTVNNNAQKMGVDLVEADGDVSKSEKPTDVFPAGATEYLAIADRPIENIIERGGYIYFNYRGATGVEDVLGIEAKVLAIYNVLGQKLADTEIQSLSHGAYVIVTSAGNYKIVR